MIFKELYNNLGDLVSLWLNYYLISSLHQELYRGG